MTSAETENKQYDDFVDDTDAYQISSKDRKNTKNDAGATRFRKIPLHKIDLDSEIPEEPQEKHDKPNDSHYEKELAKIDQEIKNHEKSIDEIKAKIRAERTGNKPGTEDLITKVKELNEKIKEINAQVTDLENTSKGPVELEKKYKEKRDKLEKEIDVKNYDKLMSEIRFYQEQLGFGTLSASEEKKIMDKKSRLETQVGSTKAYQETKDKLKSLKDANKDLFDKLKDLRGKRKVMIEERKAISAKIDESKATVTENNQVINQFKEQLDSINNEIRSLNKKYRDLEYEWNDKWFKYEKYMDIVTYIREAKKKQNDIKKREEKLKKKEEKEAKKNNKTVEAPEIKVEVSDDTVETQTCKILIEYFKSIISQKEEKKEEKIESTDISGKIAEDLKKGNLEVFDRNAINSTQVLGIGGGPAKKKVKGPKVSKREQKLNSTDLLVLSVGTLGQVKSIGLIAPNKRDQIEPFIKSLEGRLVELKEEALKARNQPKVEVEKNEENK
jgi:uncharacterized coiled-coil DUF342 family protein